MTSKPGYDFFDWQEKTGGMIFDQLTFSEEAVSAATRWLVRLPGAKDYRRTLCITKC